MLEFNNRLKKIKFDERSYTETFHRTMGQIFRQAIRAWLVAILEFQGGHFPVKTGTAKSTFKKVQDRLSRPAVTVDPTMYRKGKGPDVGYSHSKFVVYDKGPNYSFHWSTTVLHYYLNETYTMSNVPDTPWESLKAGEEAFIDYIEQNAVERMPNIFDYFRLE